MSLRYMEKVFKPPYGWCPLNDPLPEGISVPVLVVEEAQLNLFGEKEQI